MLRSNENSLLGNLVAEEMVNIMESKKHQSLFAKTAAKKEKKEEKKEAKCKCTKDCKCYKNGKHDDKACKCMKKSEKKNKKAEFESLVNTFVSLSEQLDSLDLSKTSAKVLDSLNCLISEAAGEGAGSIEELVLENPELEVDLTEAVVREDDLEPYSVEEPDYLDEPAMSLEEQIRQIEEMGLEESSPDSMLPKMEELGLAGQQPDLGLAKEIETACREIDQWIKEASDSLDSYYADDEEEEEDFEDE